MYNSIYWGVVRKMMKSKITCFIIIFLMLILSLSVATNSLNDEVEVTNLDETSESLNVILPASQLNVPGHQQGSIFTDTTISSGHDHTCAILDDRSV